MDDFLSAVGVQAMRYAIRSGIALTSTYALGQCSRLLKSVDDKSRYSELRALQKQLDSKIKIISPAIDLVELKSGRGNIFLESAVPLAKSLHQEIVSLGRRIEEVAAAEEQRQEVQHGAKSEHQANHPRLKNIAADIKQLLDRIDCEIPLLQLAISASGESLSTSLPAGISPSRLLQASTLLIVGDTQYAQDPTRPVQIGPAFTLSVYMLFLGHASVTSTGKDNGAALEGGQTSATSYGLREGERKPLWQEAIHKARVRLCRSARPLVSSDGVCTPPANDRSGEYAYHIEIIEDLDDGRVHDQSGLAKAHEGITITGIRECVPIHQVSKLFYTDTGRLLNIGDDADGENNPVLLLKRDVKANRCLNATQNLHQYVAATLKDADEAYDGDGDIVQADIDRQLLSEMPFGGQLPADGPGCRDDVLLTFPLHLDPEWIAFEVFEEDVEEGDDSQLADDAQTLDDKAPKGQLDNTLAAEPGHKRSSLDSTLVNQIKNLSLRSAPGAILAQASSEDLQARSTQDQNFVARSPFRAITSSLSLIEMLIRLASLQEFQQASHLSIPDHILTFFLEETSTTGFTGEARWQARNQAKQRVGFDPYTDTLSE